MPVFQLVAAVPVGTAKRACFTCDHATRAAYIRTHVDIDYEGELVICKVCAETMARTLGWSHRASVDENKRINRDLREENKALTARVADLQRLEAAVVQASVALSTAEPVPSPA